MARNGRSPNGLASRAAVQANAPQGPSGAEGVVEQAMRIIRRRKAVFLSALFIVPLVALALSLAQDDQYTATATLLFRQAPEGLTTEGDSGFVDPAREAATNDELVTLPVVADRAAKVIGEGYDGDDVLATVAVDSGGDADVAEISATTGSPELSAKVANAYGEAYIEFRREADRAQVQSAIDLVQEGLDNLSPTEQAGEQGAVLTERLDRLELAQALQTGKAELVQQAEPPADRSSPKPKRNLALGIILGALLGFALSALLERIDRRVRTVEEFEELFGVPVLARIPRSRSLGRGRDTDSGATAPTPEGEAFRVLRTNLRYFNVDNEMRSILIASPGAGDGKSTISRNLARTMAEMGDNVILVEADLHKGSRIGEVASGKPKEGLSTVLVGSSLERALTEVEVTSATSGEERVLTVLPSGPIPPNPSELLESERMRDLLAKLQERFDLVVIDSPALSVMSDALALVPEVSGIVVVGGLGQTTRDAVRDFDKQLSLLGRQPIGVVANFTEIERGGHSYYHRSAAVRTG